ncbi:MAG: DUF896 domain-containing protein [Firmicutes bacterium]|nr:DUF896 domain-containing protein [Bacillota bacterium]
MEQYKIDRINALAKKSKTQGLTPEEKEEQAVLRQEFLADFRAAFKQQLDRIELVDDKTKEEVDIELDEEEKTMKLN